MKSTLKGLVSSVFIKHWRLENPPATTWNFLAKFHWPVEALLISLFPYSLGNRDSFIRVYGTGQRSYITNCQFKQQAQEHRRIPKNSTLR